MTTSIEIARIAAAANLLRPDWPAASIRTHLAAKHAHRPYRDLALALVWVALDEDSRTPARLDEHGPWWTLGDHHVVSTPPRFADLCRHGREGRHCPHCRQEAPT